MRLNQRKKPSENQIREWAQISEVLRCHDLEVRQLIEEHQTLSRRWFAHEILPWGEGRDFRKEPWRPEDSPLSPEMALAFETNLLTEDNLPYYHAQISRLLDENSALVEWNHLWTAEEGLHSIVMRDYAHLMRILDPEKLEKNRMQITRAGFDRHFTNLLDLFAYTSIQELATRVSHQKLGQKSQEPILQKLMALISKDENFHYIFYRALVKMMIQTIPELMLPALLRQLMSFHMPGVGLEDFPARESVAAKLGIFGAQEHRDLVVKPALSYWSIEHLSDLSPETEKVREKILRVPRILDRLVGRQEEAGTFLGS